MKFALKRTDWTDAAASLWGFDLLGLDRPATFEEAQDSLTKHGFGGHFGDYFNEDGSSKGPCALGITVESE